MIGSRSIFIGLMIGILPLVVNGSQSNKSAERAQALMLFSKEFDSHPTSDIYAVINIIQAAKAEAELQALLQLYPSHERWKVEIIHRKKIYPQISGK